MLIDLAAILGRSPANVGELVAGKRPISPEIAMALAAALETSPEYWLGLEQAYQLWRNRARDTDQVSRRARLYEYAPIREMIRRGWIEGSGSIDELESSVCRFFGVRSLDETAGLLDVAARKSTPYSVPLTPAQRAWVTRAKQLACSVHAATFSPAKQQATVDRLRLLVHEPKESRHVPRILSDAGIRYVVVEPLGGARIDGACFWVEDGPVIAMSLRFDRIDNFWFCLFHELHHVYGKDVSIDADLDGSQRDPVRPAAELAADDFAVRTLIDPAALENFMVRKRPLYSKIIIEAFAKTKNVHPGIVVGQLQTRGELQWANLRKLLVPIREIVISSALTDGWGCVVPSVGQ